MAEAVSAPALPLPVVGRDVTVPLADGTSVRYAALDYAASAPALQRVWDDVADYVPFYGSVHRGAGHLSQISTRIYEEARQTVADFLDLRADDHLVFTRATTDSLNLLASCLPAGTEVYVFETEHHAALLPWERGAEAVHYLAAPTSPQEAVRLLDEALGARPAYRRERLVCVTGASNVTGEVWPIRELAETAHRHGARIVLDAAQLAPHRRVSVQELGVDWVALSGHKLYAPFGSGVLAGRSDWLTAARPYLAGGGATRAVRRDGEEVAVEWNEDLSRHEAGSPNVIGAHALAAACKALQEAGWDRLEAREAALVARLRDGLAAVPGVRLLSLFGGAAEGVGVLSFVVDGWDSGKLAAALSSRYGIGVRDGLFCAHPLTRRLVGDADAACGTGDGSGTAVRASFGAGTPDEHVDRLVAAVRELTA
ncbi:cysteine desulfurase [Mangrovactinospora gilvigrisea]|uniref:Cysteine desulfurase n=1 Tax=Mangrovactinospora gilvigrisea TaxID=1428644 RepID=A0A1J7C208_9ACTN|nr:aminotransferase class V-fold PLP-dependent enzyme [Mangrovactinospora gilvigrisea]OIV35620.1 cysteine desulfurase [Mangrovactinospora gilvigrisea]